MRLFGARGFVGWATSGVILNAKRFVITDTRSLQTLTPLQNEFHSITTDRFSAELSVPLTQAYHVIVDGALEDGAENYTPTTGGNIALMNTLPASITMITPNNFSYEGIGWLQDYRIFNDRFAVTSMRALFKTDGPLAGVPPP